MRRRLWATVMEMNVQAALDAGMPPNILLRDFDTEPPSSLNDRDINDCTKEMAQSSATKVTDTSLQRFLFNSLGPRLEILRIMNGVSSEMTQAEVIALTSEIKNACIDRRTHIRVNHNDVEEQVFCHNLTDLFLRRFLLSLHRPWANRARTSPLFYFSRKVVYDSATALLLPQHNEDFTHLILRGGGIFKNRMIHVSLALASELLVEIEEQGSPTSFMDQPWNYRNMLLAAVKEAQQQSAQRMRFGETNVRLHMKLSIVLSQAEDLLPGQSRQEQMIQSAKNSLEMSYGTIKAQLSLSSTTSLREDGSSNVLREDDQLAFSSPFLNLDDIFQDSEFNSDGALFRLF
jgi:hypothetical protein